MTTHSTTATTAAEEEYKVPTFNDTALAFVSPYQVAMMALNLKALIDAGLPMVKTLQLIAVQNVDEAPRISVAFNAACEAVQNGKSLGEALKPYSKDLGELCVCLIAAGEKSGNLTTVALPSVFRAYTNKAEVRAANKIAAIYPFFVFLGILGVTYVLCGVLTPALRPIYDTFGGEDELPALTRFVLMLSAVMTSWTGRLVIAGVISAVISLFVFCIFSPKLREKRDRWKLKVPKYGRVWLREASGEAFNTLGAMLAGGVTMTQALVTSAEVCPNTALANVFLEAKHDLESQGGEIWPAIKRSGLFLPNAVTNIQTGERAGTLDTMAMNLAELYFVEAKNMRKALEIWREHLLIVVMAVWVGVLALGMMLPMFSLYEKLAGGK